MKTIKEKIREFAGKLTPCGICNRKECRVEIEDCAWYKDIYKALSEVAKLQEEIDINKACQWFESYLAEIGYPDDWLRDSPNMESGKDRFRKAIAK